MERITNKQANIDINKKLSEIYAKHTEETLSEWAKIFKKEPPFRINEFGIIDPERYDTDNGILFVGRETNNWKDEDFQEGCLFRSWLQSLSKNGLGHGEHVSKHPNIWYNTGRWAMLLQSPETPIEELVNLKSEAVDALGTIAFTNVNKVRGNNQSRKEYHNFSKSDIAIRVLAEEISIIKPKVIITCGTQTPVAAALSKLGNNLDIKVIIMKHPAARIGTEKMLRELKAQI